MPASGLCRHATPGNGARPKHGAQNVQPRDTHGNCCSLSQACGPRALVHHVIQSGVGKIFGYAEAQAVMEQHGLSGALLPLVILTEAGGGHTPYAAIALAGFCVLAAWFFHYQPGDMGQMINFMKNLTIAGGFLVLAGADAGALALDNLRR
jgi:putative oxidoreductase